MKAKKKTAALARREFFSQAGCMGTLRARFRRISGGDDLAYIARKRVTRECLEQQPLMAELAGRLLDNFLAGTVRQN